ncbi:MAG: hypothetical protein OHK005_04610 [Candidatus Methylacidiphilales bacterium]
MTSLLLSGPVTDVGFLFLSLIVQGVPFLLAGAAVSTLVTQWVPVERILQNFPRRPWVAAACGAGVGFLIPTCECAAVPLVRRLLLRGLPASAALGYLFGSPALNPLALISTWIAYQGNSPWLMVALRAVGGFVIAVGVAWGLTARGNWFAIRGEVALPSGGVSEPATSIPAVPVRSGSGLAQWGLATWNDFWVVSIYYTIGCLLAASLQIGVPFEGMMGGDGVGAIASMMGLAVIMSICSSADAFVANSFVTVPSAAQLAFLWTGPVLDLKLVWMYRLLLRRRAIAILAVAVILGVGLISWLLLPILW